MEPRAGRLFRRYSGSNLELPLIYLFLIGLVSLPFTVLGLLFIFRHGHATAFPPEDPHVGWVENPGRRGTLNIIWTCFSTIFTCVYVSVHIDISDPQKPDRFQESLSRAHTIPKAAVRYLFAIWRFLSRPVTRKVIWVLFNIYAPELMVMCSLLERKSAKSGVAFMHSRGQAGWKMRHAFFADMGGFKLPDGTLLHTGLEFYEWYDRERPTLNYEEIEHDIRDRSKANVVLKLYTCAQASWLLIETVWRLVRHQPVSELEITTCSYIVCAIATYTCWLHKPYGVGGCITLHLPSVSASELEKKLSNDDSSDTLTLPSESPLDSATLVAPSLPQDSSRPLPDGSSSEPLLPRSSSIPYATDSDAVSASTCVAFEDKEKQTRPLPTMIFPGARTTPFNRAWYNPDRSWSNSSHLTGLCGAVIGVIHGVPFWNSLFVNTEGQWLWRACCGVQVLFPPMLALVALVEWWYDGILLWLWLLVAAFIYCVSRVVLFALIWLSFLSLPIGVYRNVDWAWGWVPHWH